MTTRDMDSVIIPSSGDELFVDIQAAERHLSEDRPALLFAENKPVYRHFPSSVGDQAPSTAEFP